MSDNETIDIVFDGPPGPQSGRFVEVETVDGHGLARGEWIERDDGRWVLRLGDPETLARWVSELREENAALRARAEKAEAAMRRIAVGLKLPTGPQDFDRVVTVACAAGDVRSEAQATRDDAVEARIETDRKYAELQLLAEGLMQQRDEARAERDVAHEGWSRAASARDIALGDRDALRRELRGIVAVIDRDGGHAQDADRTLTASIKRASSTVVSLFAENAALRARAEKAEARDAWLKDVILRIAEAAKFKRGDAACMYDSDSSDLIDLVDGLRLIADALDDAIKTGHAMASHHERCRMQAERERDEARAERDALQRHYDAAAPEHNLLALLDLYESRCDARPLLTSAHVQALIEAADFAVEQMEDEVDEEDLDEVSEAADILRAHAERAGKEG